jgi:hypothetical protein
MDLAPIGALGQGGPSVSRVAHVDQEEAQVLPPCMGTWRIVA